jgi:cytoskeletal protein CcmA (bactofilin family)
MAYIGQEPVNTFSPVPSKDSFTGDGSTTTFDLQNPVVNGGENALEVFVNNVRQEPGSGKAFTLGVDGSNEIKRITFSSAPANGAAIYVINDKTSNVSTVSPTDLNGVELILDLDADTSLTADTDDRIDFKLAGTDHIQLGTSSGDTTIKIATDAKDLQFLQADGNKIFEINDGNFVGVGGNSAAPGEIRIYEDTDNGSHYTGFKAGNNTASVAYVLPTADGSAGTQLTTDGSGTLSWSAATLSLTNDGNNRITTGTGSGGLNAEANLTFDGSTLALTGAATVSSTLAVSGVTTSNAGVVVDNITIDGTEIDLSSGDLTVDVAGDINLDADGGDILFKDGGTTIATLSNSSSDFIITTGVQDKDFVIKGDDNGSAITALTIDMSEAGAATFNNKIVATELDISGNVDIDGSLETDALTIGGDTIAEVISDTVGAMVSSNTETGITVSYEDGDNTLDFAIAAAQTTITSLLATDIKIGEDDQTKIDFETADEIHFYAANVEQVYLGDNIFGPQSDSDVDLGSNSVRWKDAYIDTITTTSLITSGAGLVIADAGNIGSASDTDAIAIASNGQVTLTQTLIGTALDISGDIDVDGTTNLDVVDIDGAVDMASTLGVTGVVTANAGVVIDNITIDGTEIDLSSGDLTVDVAGDITLDADGGDFKFSDGGTQILNIANSSSDVVIKPTVDTKDLIFQQYDGTEVFRVEDGAYMSLAAMSVNPEATLTDASTISWNSLTSPVAKVTLGANRTIGAATGAVAGTFASLLVIQDGTGSRTLTWNAAYEFASDTAPTLTTTANLGDLFVFRYNGSKWLEVGRNLALTLS